jgi:hypothetical protein
MPNPMLLQSLEHRSRRRYLDDDEIHANVDMRIHAERSWERVQANFSIRCVLMKKEETEEARKWPLDLGPLSSKLQGAGLSL